MVKSKFLTDKIDELNNQGLFRELKVASSSNNSLQFIDGKEVINLCSNNYLGLADHPRLKQVAINAINKYGVGSGSVRTINGNFDLHEELDKKLAHFKQEEAAHHFQSGFNCNLGAIQALVDKDDLIISDELNHASIIDGVRLSRADKKVYKHTDINHLELILKQERNKYNNVLIISDGVFSMDGNIAPIPDIVKLANNYDALTYIDDAHGSGVLGTKGKGTIDHFNLNGQINFIVGTLSKAIGSIGGYIAGNKDMYQWFNHRARTLLFSTSLPPASVAASIEALNILEESDVLTQKLWSNTRFFQTKLKENGFNIGKTQTPITPIFIYDEEKTIAMSNLLMQEGIYVSPIVFPTVATNQARIRCMISANHSKEQLDYVVKSLIKVRDKLNLS